jgi:hypothetical protein
MKNYEKLLEYYYVLLFLNLWYSSTEHGPRNGLNYFTFSFI